jgi:GTP cyclohydrolase II
MSTCDSQAASFSGRTTTLDFERWHRHKCLHHHQRPSRGLKIGRRKRHRAEPFTMAMQPYGAGGNGIRSAAQLHQQVETPRPPSEGAAVSTTFVAETLLPTTQGKFRLRGYRHTTDGGSTYTEPTAIISGQVEGLSKVVVRVHDACFTSEVLGSLKCDCREQLALSMEYIQNSPPGMVIYLQQEGRGIGLANKIAAYALQERGLDTVDANRALGLPDDCREYTAVRDILEDLGVKSVRLMVGVEYFPPRPCPLSLSLSFYPFLLLHHSNSNLADQ